MTKSRETSSVKNGRGSWRKACAGLGILLLGFCLIQSFLPLRTAVQIGADEGFELAKATLCAHGHKLYTEIWNDQPPLHTFLTTQIVKHVTRSVLGPRLLTSGFTLVLLASVFLLIRRLAGLGTAFMAVAMLIASPGFLELSASCMLEIPALATALAGLCLLASLRVNRGWLAEIMAGILFGMALQIKLINLIWTPLAAFLICYRQMPSGSETFSTFVLTMKSGVVIKRALVFGVTMMLAWLAVDLAVDQGAYLANFQQSWRSHFAAVKTTEYGTPSEHVFEWVLFFRNWDTTVPALAGLAVAAWRFRRQVALLFPLAWFVWAVIVFVNHKPWWPYYYVHLAVPLCWLAALGFRSVATSSWEIYKARKHPSVRRKTWKAALPLAGTAIFAVLAALWMGGRIYLQISSMRHQPRTFNSLVIAEAERYKPYVHWLFTDNLALSFHTDIPMPPPLAVVPLKRLWSGEMTVGRMVEEFARYRPELVILNNQTTWVPYRELLDQDYRLVYQDNAYQLYALKFIHRPASP